MEDKEIIDRVKTILHKLAELLKTNPLYRIPQLTYEMRQAGEDMIYFTKGTWNQHTKYLVPQPIIRQKLYKELFERPVKGCISLPAYTIYIYEDKIEFIYKEKLDGQIKKETILYIPITKPA